jgi:hypothetical protein
VLAIHPPLRGGGGGPPRPNCSRPLLLRAQVGAAYGVLGCRRKVAFFVHLRAHIMHEELVRAINRQAAAERSPRSLN